MGLMSLGKRLVSMRLERLCMPIRARRRSSLAIGTLGGPFPSNTPFLCTDKHSLPTGSLPLSLTSTDGDGHAYCGGGGGSALMFPPRFI